MSDPQPNVPPAPGQFQQPPAQKKSGLPGWAIALIAVLASLVVICAVGAVVVIGVLNSLGSRVSQVTTQINAQVNSSIASSTVPVATGGAKAIGDQVTAGDLAFTVRSAAPITPSSDALPPEAGKQYFAVTLDVTNTSSAETVLTSLSSHIQDGAGSVFSVSLFGQTSAGTSSSSLLETLPAKATQSVTMVYEVPTAAGELYWVYGESETTSAVVKVR